MCPAHNSPSHWLNIMDSVYVLFPGSNAPGWTRNIARRCQSYLGFGMGPSIITERNQGKVSHWSVHPYDHATWLPFVHSTADTSCSHWCRVLKSSVINVETHVKSCESLAKAPSTFLLMLATGRLGIQIPFWRYSI